MQKIKADMESDEEQFPIAKVEGYRENTDMEFSRAITKKRCVIRIEKTFSK